MNQGAYGSGKGQAVATRPPGEVGANRVAQEATTKSGLYCYRSLVSGIVMKFVDAASDILNMPMLLKPSEPALNILSSEI